MRLQMNHKIFLPDADLYQYSDKELGQIFQNAVDTLPEDDITSFRPKRDKGLGELPFLTQSQLDLFNVMWNDWQEPFLLATRRMGKTDLSVKFSLLFLLYSLDALDDKVVQMFGLDKSDKIEDLIDRAKHMSRGLQVVHANPSQEQANRNIKPVLDNTIRYLKQYKFVKDGVNFDTPKTEEVCKITYKSKSATYRYVGISLNSDNLRGGGCDILILDEIQDVSKEIVDRIISIFLKDTEGIRIGVGTAKSRADLISMAEDAINAPHKTLLVKTIWDRYRYGEVSKWGIIKTILDYQSDGGVYGPIFKNEFECNWLVRFKNSILRNFKFKPFEVNEGLPIMASMDLGRKDEYVVFIWRYTPDQDLIWDDAYLFNDKTTPEVIDIVKEKYPFIDQVIVPHDATARVTQTRNTDKGLWEASDIAGRIMTTKSNVVKRRKADEVRWHLNYLNRVYVNSNNIPDEILLKLKNWQYDEKRDDGHPLHDSNSHVGDAWLYGISTFFNKHFEPIQKHGQEDINKSQLQQFIDDGLYKDQRVSFRDYTRRQHRR